MNVQCLKCEAICTVAVLRGGGAVPMFRCRLEGNDRAWTHLMPGDRLACFTGQPEPAIAIQDPHQNEEQHDGTR